MRFGQQERVHNGQLGWTNGPGKLPVHVGRLGHLTLGDLAVSLNPKVLGQIQRLGVFVPHLVLGLKLRLDNGEGADGKGFFQHRFTMVLWDLVSLKGQHEVCLNRSV